LIVLQHSGKLLIKVRGQSYNDLVSGTGFLDSRHYQIKPLFEAYQRTPAFSPEKPEDIWFLVTPSFFDPSLNPWDLAHQIAREKRYSFFAEPDLLQVFFQETEDRAWVPPAKGLNKNWPPPGPVSPGWHLLPGFTDFVSAHKTAMGKGIRIAHLDTGYWPWHDSTPKNVKPKLGWNFYEGNPNTVDSGIGYPWDPPPAPGHGTATLALLAGNKLNLTFAGHRFSGYFGGAPESEVVPVRIAASVIHLWTSTMAQGIGYALAPRGDRTKKCDVITISHGGLPAASWADAVNLVYEAGIVVAAASGDNIVTAFGPFPFSDTIWPSRFNRAITVVGATYDKTPYVTNVLGEIEEDWGPDKNVMKKAIAAYTPNVAWMKFRTRHQYEMDGAGTSSSTPQVAAACSLWLELYGAKYPADWRRVEACRQALFLSASAPAPEEQPDTYLGRGILNVPALLDSKLAKSIQKDIRDGKVPKQPIDRIDFVLGRKLLRIGTPATEEERMYVVEMAQVAVRLRHRGIFQPRDGLKRLRQLITDEPDVSVTLREKIAGAQ
jgi:Subtilase family